MSLDEIKISVIMPVYNMEKYICDSIESVLMQDIVDLELLCVDDGSTDDSRKLIERYRQKDKRVKYYYQDNQGSGMARNAGMNYASGRYVAFLDPDDLYDNKSALRLLYNACVENNVVMAGGNHKEFSDENDYGLKSIFPVFDQKTADEIKKHNDGMVLTFREYIDSWYWNFIYERTFLLDNSIIFPDYRRHQDPPFFYKALWTAGSFFYVSIFVLDYRVSIVHKQSLIDENIDQVLCGIRDVISIADKSGNKRLYEEQMRAINYSNYMSIMTNLSPAVLRPLLDIYDINKSSRFRSEIRVFDDICRGAVFISEHKERCDYSVSHYLQREIDEIHRDNKSLSDYFSKRGIDEIVIYGMGNRGLHLIDILEKEGIKVRYGIDKNVKSVESIRVLGIGDSIPEVFKSNVAILVSLRNANEIIEEIRGYYSDIPIYGIESVIWDIDHCG